MASNKNEFNFTGTVTLITGGGAGIGRSTSPTGKESNWVPTDPKRQFELLFRLYGPKKELFEKTWKLSDVQEMK
jgi:hypothetical protein